MLFEDFGFDRGRFTPGFERASRLIHVLALGIPLLLAAGCSESGDGKALADSTASRGVPPASGSAAQALRPPQGGMPQMQFRLHPIIDKQQGGLVLATIAVPQNWKVVSNVEWNYQDVSHPVRATARAEAPDGSAWVEYFPVEIFYWLEPIGSPVPIGDRNLGMIHKPNIGIQEAMRRFVITPYRGNRHNLQVVGFRPVVRLAEAFGAPSSPGEAISMRIRYIAGGETVDEDIYGMLGSGNRIPYQGPQGTWYESHRPLVFVHAMGATNGGLESMYPLLGFIATSLKVDPAWEAHRQRVMQQLSAEFDQLIARGYAQIQAAAQLSRTISANNDAMLASMQAQRQAQAQRDAAGRESASSRSASEDFSLYIRGTERMKDPYWGESEQSYHQRYHWTDGSGNYRSSNDSNFNPNIGAGGGQTWQRMEPVDR